MNSGDNPTSSSPEEDGVRRSERLRSRNRFSDLPSRTESGESSTRASPKKADRWSSEDSEMSENDDALDFTTPASAVFPPTYLILRLAPNIQPAAVAWLVKKITGKKQEGGAELLVRSEPYSGRKKESLVLHISASKLKFLELAEYWELKKLDIEGQLREFTVGDLDNFLHGGTTLDNLLTAAEKQMIVVHELENIRSAAGEEIVPGYPTLSVFVGQSIFNTYLSENLILSYYPLHDEKELSDLGSKWYPTLFKAQPFQEIREYFGESISLYFSFLGFYTTSLCAPAVLGILHLLFPESASNYSLIFFCIFNVIWVTVTLELWKRKCNELAYTWGTLRMTKWENPRSNYRGKMCLDPVTGRYQPKYPWWKTCVKVYGVSFPIVVICLSGAFYIMLYSFWVEEMLMEMELNEHSILTSILVYLPSIVYAVLVYMMNFYYRQLANYLTEWENHRTQSQFERNRVLKLVLFEFVNNFMSLFYIAFYLQDFEMLKYQVFVMLIILQAINHVQEALLPLFIRKTYTVGVTFVVDNCPKLARFVAEEEKDPNFEQKGRKNASKTGDAESICDPQALGLQTLDSTDPRIQKSKLEGEMDPYEGTFDDYLEMFIQFGYVFLFSSVYPLAAVWAILNNVLEIRTDAFKLCRVFQRPIAKRTKDIGAWQIAFEVMCAIAIMTNCGLLCLSSELRALVPASMTQAEWVLIFVCIEHCLLGLSIALQQLIPDVPQKIKMAMARLEFQSRQALKNEQTFKSRRQLTRRFKTVHGPRNANVKRNLEAIGAQGRTPSPVPRHRTANIESTS